MSDDTYSWSGNFSDLGPDDQSAVARLVVQGKAVSGTVGDLIMRLRRSRNVALLRETDTSRIVAAAALKQPTAVYRRDKFNKAGASIAGFEAALELGYVVISPDMQGRRLSGGLVTAIVEQVTGPTFATTDSNTMRKNLERSSFIRVGDEWQGQRGMLSLWTITP